MTIEVMCEDCREAFPSNETISFTERVLASTRNSSRVYRGTRGGVGFGGSTGATYRYRERTICFGCAEIRADAIRATRRRRRIRNLLLFVLLAGGLGYCVKHLPALPDASNGIAPDQMPNTSNNSQPDAIRSSFPTPSTESRPNDASQERPTPSPSDIGHVDVMEHLPDPKPLPTERPLPQITRSILDALDRGDTVRWRDDNGSGYILVSEEQTYASKTCRNVTITHIHEQDQYEDPAVLWCKPDGGTWVASN
jgi:hypothetical protein